MITLTQEQFNTFKDLVNECLAASISSPDNIDKDLPPSYCDEYYIPVMAVYRAARVVRDKEGE